MSEKWDLEELFFVLTYPLLNRRCDSMNIENITVYLKSLDNRVLTTYSGKEFSMEVNEKYVIATPHSTMKRRNINIEKEILPAYRYLHQGNAIEGVGNGKKSVRVLGFSKANPSFVWAILREFDDIHHVGRRLFMHNLDKMIIPKYVQRAMAKAKYKRYPDGNWWGEIYECPGTNAFQSSPEECKRELREVVEEWIEFKMSFGDTDFAIIDGIDINPLSKCPKHSVLANAENLSQS